MLAFIGLLVLLQIFRPDPFDGGAWLRICVYGLLGFVCPAAVIPVGLCWLACLAISGKVGEIRRDRQAKRARTGFAAAKPASPPRAFTMQVARAIFWTTKLLGKERGFGGTGGSLPPRQGMRRSSASQGI